MKHSPPVAWLDGILPDATDTLLLRACLLTGEEGARAWEAWREAVGSPRLAFEREFRGLKGLLPLLQRSLKRNGVKVDEWIATYLKAARFREELRLEMVRGAFAEISGAWASEGISSLALGGLVLAETVYEDPPERHVHGVDFVIPEQKVELAAHLAGDLGYVREAGPEGVRGRAPAWAPRIFRHRTQLLLQLHTRFIPSPAFEVPLEPVLARSVPALVADAPARIPSPADLFVHALGRAISTESRLNLRWTCDACRLLRRHPDLDWTVVAETSRAAGLDLPMHVLMSYLAAELNAPIPEQVRDRLRDGPAAPEGIERETLFLGSYHAIRPALKVVQEGADGWAERAELLRFLLLPSPRWLEKRHGPLAGWRMPELYLTRPLGYARGRLRQRLIRYRESRSAARGGS